MNSKTVGAKIVKMRKERAYTQAALAERLNVSNKTVSRWETGDGFPEISLLPKLAAELGISVDELLSEDDIGKGYAVTADIAVLYLLYSIFIILPAKANKTESTHIRVE